MVSILDIVSDLTSFWKTATLGKEGFREFNLVYGSKSQQQISTETFLKSPPPAIIGTEQEIQLPVFEYTYLFFVHHGKREV